MRKNGAPPDEYLDDNAQDYPVNGEDQTSYLYDTSQRYEQRQMVVTNAFNAIGVPVKRSSFKNGVMIVEIVSAVVTTAVSAFLLSSVDQLSEDEYSKDSVAGGLSCSSLIKDHLILPRSLCLACVVTSAVWLSIQILAFLGMCCSGMCKLDEDMQRRFDSLLVVDVYVNHALLIMLSAVGFYCIVFIESGTLPVSDNYNPLSYGTSKAKRNLLYKDPACNANDDAGTIGKHLTESFQYIGVLVVVLLCLAVFQSLVGYVGIYISSQGKSAEIQDSMVQSVDQSATDSPSFLQSGPSTNSQYRSKNGRKYSSLPSLQMSR